MSLIEKLALKAGYGDKKATNMLEKRHSYLRDKELSNEHTKVFYNENQNPLIVSRGTVNKRDVANDALIAAGLGSFGNRYLKTRDIVKKTEAKYKKPADIVGHSLGGYYAQNSGVHGKITTVNKAITPSGVFKTIPKNQTDYIVKGDPVSALAYTQFGNKHIIQNKTGSAHDLANFTD